jgi:hypothetical protein
MMSISISTVRLQPLHELAARLLYFHFRGRDIIMLDPNPVYPQPPRGFYREAMEIHS